MEDIESIACVQRPAEIGSCRTIHSDGDNCDMKPLSTKSGVGQVIFTNTLVTGDDFHCVSHGERDGNFADDIATLQLACCNMEEKDFATPNDSKCINVSQSHTSSIDLRQSSYIDDVTKPGDFKELDITPPMDDRGSTLDLEVYEPIGKGGINTPNAEKASRLAVHEFNSDGHFHLSMKVNEVASFIGDKKPGARNESKAPSCSMHTRKLHDVGLSEGFSKSNCLYSQRTVHDDLKEVKSFGPLSHATHSTSHILPERNSFEKSVQNHDVMSVEKRGKVTARKTGTPVSSLGISHPSDGDDSGNACTSIFGTITHMTDFNNPKRCKGADSLSSIEMVTSCDNRESFLGIRVSTNQAPLLNADLSSEIDPFSSNASSTASFNEVTSSFSVLHKRRKKSGMYSLPGGKEPLWKKHVSAMPEPKICGSIMSEAMRSDHCSSTSLPSLDESAVGKHSLLQCTADQPVLKQFPDGSSVMNSLQCATGPQSVETTCRSGGSNHLSFDNGTCAPSGALGCASDVARPLSALAGHRENIKLISSLRKKIFVNRGHRRVPASLAAGSHLPSLPLRVNSVKFPGPRSILPKGLPTCTVTCDGAVPDSTTTITACAAPLFISIGLKCISSSPSPPVQLTANMAAVSAAKMRYSVLPAVHVTARDGVGVAVKPGVFSFPPIGDADIGTSTAVPVSLFSSSMGNIAEIASCLPPSRQVTAIGCSEGAGAASAKSDGSQLRSPFAEMNSSPTCSAPIFVHPRIATTGPFCGSSPAQGCFRSGSRFAATSGVLLPVTPPKTPEGESAAEGITNTSDGDNLPLCFCNFAWPANANHVPGMAVYCQALESVDGGVLGCCNQVTERQLVRPGVKIPFMVMCELHRRRLRQHRCCPGCGQFCSQGKFLRCNSDSSFVHHFHRQCQTERSGVLFCPHCGEESDQVEVTLVNHAAQISMQRPLSAAGSIKIGCSSQLCRTFARMTPCTRRTPLAEGCSPSSPVSVTLPNKRTISSDGLSLGVGRETIERLIKLCQTDGERPKRCRVVPKNMILSALEGDVDRVFYMLLDGFDPNDNVDDESGDSVLHAAIQSGNLDLVYILVQAGACLHTVNSSLKTPLMCAAELGWQDIFVLLVKAGAGMDAKGEDGMTCLHYAAKFGRIDVIKYILDTETVDVNSSEENNSLHWAAYSGSCEIAELFLNLGSELDTPNERGDRPLHIAARQAHYDIVVVLLARGADVELRNEKGETPIECCLDQNSTTCLALRVNRRLRQCASRMPPAERLVHRDISLGRERYPVACVNAVNDEPVPSDYLYVNHSVETQDLHVNIIITSLQSCRCNDGCSSMFCPCARSSVRCWFDMNGRLSEEFNFQDPPLIFECNRACRCWVNCNNRVAQNGISVRIQVFRTEGRGWGLRALMDIPKGTFICEYMGELISDCEADRREDDSYLFDLDNKDGDTYCLDARNYGNVARFINHLCEPNLIPVKVFVDHQDLRFPRICFFSSRDISAYEEFGFDYGDKFWIIKWKQFTCNCRSSKCKYSADTIQRTLEEYRIRREMDDARG